jgi:arsenate reductase
MAEGLATQIFGDKATIESAGSVPNTVNPFAIQAMKEIGIDITSHSSKSFDELSPRFIVGLKYVITLCAEEVCPQMVSRAEKIHWPIKDPAAVDGTEEEKIEAFRIARDEIKQRIESFYKQMT